MKPLDISLWAGIAATYSCDDRAVVKGVDAEYELIQQKKSKLSAAKRRGIVRVYNLNQEGKHQ
jgi:hypothetical protein